MYTSMKVFLCLEGKNKNKKPVQLLLLKALCTRSYFKFCHVSGISPRH